jgi:hypothetical protein
MSLLFDARRTDFKLPVVQEFPQNVNQADAASDCEKELVGFERGCQHLLRERGGD